MAYNRCVICNWNLAINSSKRCKICEFNSNPANKVKMCIMCTDFVDPDHHSCAMCITAGCRNYVSHMKPRCFACRHESLIEQTGSTTGTLLIDPRIPVTHKKTLEMKTDGLFKVSFTHQSDDGLSAPGFGNRSKRSDPNSNVKSINTNASSSKEPSGSSYTQHGKGSKRHKSDNSHVNLSTRSTEVAVSNDRSSYTQRGDVWKNINSHTKSATRGAAAPSSKDRSVSYSLKKKKKTIDASSKIESTVCNTVPSHSAEDRYGPCSRYYDESKKKTTDVNSNVKSSIQSKILSNDRSESYAQRCDESMKPHVKLTTQGAAATAADSKDRSGSFSNPQASILTSKEFIAYSGSNLPKPTTNPTAVPAVKASTHAAATTATTSLANQFIKCANPTCNEFINSADATICMKCLIDDLELSTSSSSSDNDSAAKNQKGGGDGARKKQKEAKCGNCGHEYVYKNNLKRHQNQTGHEGVILLTAIAPISTTSSLPPPLTPPHTPPPPPHIDNPQPSTHKDSDPKIAMVRHLAFCLKTNYFNVSAISM